MSERAFTRGSKCGHFVTSMALRPQSVMVARLQSNGLMASDVRQTWYLFCTVTQRPWRRCVWRRDKGVDLRPAVRKDPKFRARTFFEFASHTVVTPFECIRLSGHLLRLSAVRRRLVWRFQWADTPKDR